jgi:hypothetical protein
MQAASYNEHVVLLIGEYTARISNSIAAILRFIVFFYCLSRRALEQDLQIDHYRFLPILLDNSSPSRLYINYAIPALSVRAYNARTEESERPTCH